MTALHRSLRVLQLRSNHAMGWCGGLRQPGPYCYNLNQHCGRVRNDCSGNVESAELSSACLTASMLHGTGYCTQVVHTR
jgi:hypothetical protein